MCSGFCSNLDTEKAKAREGRPGLLELSDIVPPLQHYGTSPSTPCGRRRLPGTGPYGTDISRLSLYRRNRWASVSLCDNSFATMSCWYRAGVGRQSPISAILAQMPSKYTQRPGRPPHSGLRAALRPRVVQLPMPGVRPGAGNLVILLPPSASAPTPASCRTRACRARRPWRSHPPGPMMW